ncbi:MAG: SPOR domain-containing protein, partial [Prevotellaceae bacterium]|nr:SPOR domain-containing protein [Prevotellaceae bacterium]
NTQLENYHIIVGCFNTEKAAQNYFTHLKIKGIDNIYIIASTKLFRVSVGSFPTINEAKNALKNLKSFNQEFENAWVMQK